MPTAKSTLEALLVNDPSHPAIREFILKVKQLLEIADERKNVQADVTALVLVKLELRDLENCLLSG